jgi:hypothetical protein
MVILLKSSMIVFRLRVRLDESELRGLVLSDALIPFTDIDDLRSDHVWPRRRGSTAAVLMSPSVRCDRNSASFCEVASSSPLGKVWL